MKHAHYLHGQGRNYDLGPAQKLLQGRAAKALPQNLYINKYSSHYSFGELLELCKRGLAPGLSCTPALTSGAEPET